MPHIDSEASPISVDDEDIDDDGQKSAEESVDSITYEHNAGEDQHNGGDSPKNLEDEDDEGLKAQEDVDRQRMEKCYRRQEEAWLAKREKVRTKCNQWIWM